MIRVEDAISDSMDHVPSTQPVAKDCGPWYGLFKHNTVQRVRRLWFDRITVSR